MELNEGDVIEGSDGEKFRVGELIAVGCDAFPEADHSYCTVMGQNPETGEPIYAGYHCPHCGKSTGSQGHGQTGRRVGEYPHGVWRRFADGRMHFPCREDLEQLPLEDDHGHSDDRS